MSLFAAASGECAGVPAAGGVGGRGHPRGLQMEHMSGRGGHGGFVRLDCNSGGEKTEHNIAHSTIMYAMIEAKHIVSMQQPRNISCVNSVEVSIFVCGRSWNI